LELSEVSRNRGRYYRACEANPRETRFGSRFREVGGNDSSRNGDSSVIGNGRTKGKHRETILFNKSNALIFLVGKVGINKSSNDINAMNLKSDK